jgi:hypothetical protein
MQTLTFILTLERHERGGHWPEETSSLCFKCVPTSVLLRASKSQEDTLWLSPFPSHHPIAEMSGMVLPD